MDAEMILITIGGVAITVLLSIVSFFLIRLVQQLDSLDAQLSTLKTQLALYTKTVDYLEGQLKRLQDKYDALQEKYNSLEKGVAAFDNYLNRRKPKP